MGIWTYKVRVPAGEPGQPLQAGLQLWGFVAHTGWSPGCSDSKQEDLKLIFIFSLQSKCDKESLATCGSCLRPHNGWDIPCSQGLSQTQEAQSNSKSLFLLGELDKAPMVAMTDGLHSPPLKVHILTSAPQCDGFWRRGL